MVKKKMAGGRAPPPPSHNPSSSFLHVVTYADPSTSMPLIQPVSVAYPSFSSPLNPILPLSCSTLDSNPFLISYKSFEVISQPIPTFVEVAYPFLRPLGSNFPSRVPSIIPPP